MISEGIIINKSEAIVCIIFVTFLGLCCITNISKKIKWKFFLTEVFETRKHYVTGNIFKFLFQKMCLNHEVLLRRTCILTKSN